MSSISKREYKGEGGDMEFKVGDWVLFEHKVGQLKRVEAEDGWSEFSDGMFSTSGCLLDRCFPLTLEGKRCADWFEYYYHDLHQIDSKGKLNWLDVHREIVNLWEATMLALGREEPTKRAYKDAENFFRECKEALSSLREVRLANGVQLFR
jgi:hypothetical protein